MTTPATTPKRLALSALLAIAASLALPAQAQTITCYTVRNSAGTLLEQSIIPPIDLSQPISQGVAEKYGPNAKLVMWPTDHSSCPDAASVAAASPGKRDTGSFGSYQASHLTSGYNSSSYDSGSTYPSSYAHAGRTGSRRSASSYDSRNTHRSSYSSGSRSHYSGGGSRGGRGRR